MNKFAIVGSPKRRWAGYLAAVSGALFCACAAAGPAHSGDFYNPYENPYQYASYGGYGAPYYRHHSNCCGGCYSRCGGCYYSRCGGCCVTHHRSPVIERHWVEREYYERRLPVYGAYGYGYGHGYGYSNWEPPPHLGWGGIAYPSPVAYDGGPPRPPIGIPGPYYGDGYGYE